MPGQAGGSGFAAGQRRFRGARAFASRRKRRCVGPKMAAGMYLEHYLDSKSRRGGAEVAAEPARGDTDGPRGGAQRGPSAAQGARGLSQPLGRSPARLSGARSPGRAERPRPWARLGCSSFRSPDTAAPRLVCPRRKEPGAAPAAYRERELGCQWFPGIDIDNFWIWGGAVMVVFYAVSLQVQPCFSGGGGAL